MNRIQQERATLAKVNECQKTVVAGYHSVIEIVEGLEADIMAHADPADAATVRVLLANAKKQVAAFAEPFRHPGQAHAKLRALVKVRMTVNALNEVVQVATVTMTTSADALAKLRAAITKADEATAALTFGEAVR